MPAMSNLQQSSPAPPLHQQLQEYANLVEQVLKPQLLEAESAANEIRREIGDYEDLKTRLDEREKQTKEIDEKLHNQSDNIMVDLGYQTIFCNAKIKPGTATNPSLFVHVGMGFHVSMTPKEAMEFCKKRIAYLQKVKLKPRQEKMLEIQSHIQSATTLLLQLQQEMEGAAAVPGE